MDARYLDGSSGNLVQDPRQLADLQSVADLDVFKPQLPRLLRNVLAFFMAMAVPAGRKGEHENEKPSDGGLSKRDADIPVRIA